MDNAKVLQLLAVALAGWLNRHQQAIIDYLIEENRIFKQHLSGRRLHLSDDDLGEPNHQRLSNRLAEPSKPVELRTGTIQRRDRPGGLLSFYCREAARTSRRDC